MILIILQILTIILPASVPLDSHEEIWKESFSMPEKGIWADGDGNLVSDFSDVTTWTLEYQNVSLENPDDYAKTVTTSGGRFECRDIDGEVVWRSEKIDISEFDEVSVKLTAYETGSSNNHDNKYLKVFYRIDDGDEILFETNGEISGNWGSAEVAQAGLKGESIEIICYMANHYSADKVTLDEVTVSAKVSYPEIEPGDVIINEILFNPVPEGNDYVELFNLSEKEIPLKNLYLASRDNDLQLTQIYRLTEKNTRFNPGSFLALTKDTNGIFPFYFIECETCVKRVSVKWKNFLRLITMTITWYCSTKKWKLSMSCFIQKTGIMKCWQMKKVFRWNEFQHRQKPVTLKTGPRPRDLQDTERRVIKTHRRQQKLIRVP